MKKKEYSTAELLKDIELVVNGPDPAEKERDAYFNDPANAEEIAEQQTRMDLVIALYNARHEAGLTQKQLAERLGTKQAYIAQLERGRKNMTLSTITRYAKACGKKIAVTLI